MPHTHISHTSFHFGMQQQTFAITMAGWNTCSLWQIHRSTQTHTNTHTHLVPKGICPQPKSSQLLRRNSSISSVKELTKHIYLCTHTHTIHPPTHTHTLGIALILSQSVALIGVLMILWECEILQASIEWLPALYFSFKVKNTPTNPSSYMLQTIFSQKFLLRIFFLLLGLNQIFLVCTNAISAITKKHTQCSQKNPFQCHKYLMAWWLCCSQ